MRTGIARRPRVGLEPWLVGLLALGLYAATGARDVLWGDPNKLTLYVRELEPKLSQWSHFGSLLWTYPFTLLPVEPYAWRAHLSSAAAAAIALGFAHATLLALRLDRRAARIGTAAVLVAHTPWFTASMMESYPVVLAALAVATWLLVARGRPLAAGAVIGLGALAHYLCLFVVPAALYGLARSPRGRRGAARFLGGLTGGLLLPAAGVMLVSGGQGEGPGIARVLERYASLDGLGWNAAVCALYLIYNFAGPSLALLAIGLRGMPRPARGAALLLVATHYACALMWSPQRAYLIPLPLYLAAAYPISLAAQRHLLGRPRLWLALVLASPIGAYLAAPAVYARAGLRMPMRDAPVREEAAYYFHPWKFAERSARAFVDQVDRLVPRGAVLVGDFTTLSPLRYAQGAENWRPDLEIHGVDHRTDREVRASLAGWLQEERGVVFVDDRVFDRLGELERLAELRPVEPGGSTLLELAPREGARP